ncbi:hypothetical protein BCR44DRAFT_79748 [Catenaria anguillulae PL171]|uniref:Uncharacterized protein n=1 Tax=Catenaria anguillulae PL171 TaxID=765915 RepID=A0A1Y2I3J7_9FUNG|nr:hypothetical protein BCR44DRAFT_79748 [Catenaria anguillulae PL171]
MCAHVVDPKKHRSILTLALSSPLLSHDKAAKLIAILHAQLQSDPIDPLLDNLNNLHCNHVIQAIVSLDKTSSLPSDLGRPLSLTLSTLTDSSRTPMARRAACSLAWALWQVWIRRSYPCPSIPDLDQTSCILPTELALWIASLPATHVAILLLCNLTRTSHSSIPTLDDCAYKQLAIDPLRNALHAYAPSNPLCSSDVVNWYTDLVPTHLRSVVLHRMVNRLRIRLDPKPMSHPPIAPLDLMALHLLTRLDPLIAAAAVSNTVAVYWRRGQHTGTTYGDLVHYMPAVERKCARIDLVVVRMALLDMEVEDIVERYHQVVQVAHCTGVVINLELVERAIDALIDASIYYASFRDSMRDVCARVVQQL